MTVFILLLLLAMLFGMFGSRAWPWVLCLWVNLAVWGLLLGIL